MGWRFQLEYTNIVAYLCSPNKNNPPRLTSRELKEFLGVIGGQYRSSPPFISNDAEWTYHIKRAAEHASQRIQLNREADHEILDLNFIKDTLSCLKEIFDDFYIYGMPIGTRDNAEELDHFINHAAYSSKYYALFLIPDYPSNSQSLKVLDPFPEIKQVLNNPEDWPGVIFWTKNGRSVFLPLKKAFRFYQDLLENFTDGIDKIERIFAINSHRENNSKIILHLSDLHFGTMKATENVEYLSSHIHSQNKNFSQIVITGDLFDNPKREDALLFRNFKSSLERITQKEIIVIPGNHDQKFLGNSFLGIGTSLKQVINLEWRNLVIDDELKCIFYCFNSSIDANLARGKVTNKQLMDMATAFESKASIRPEIREYLSISLIHHHPYSFEARRETKIQKALSFIGLTDEIFLEMENADEFLSWCAGRKIPIILHGHKHVQRHFSKRINWNKGENTGQKYIDAIGCGTSLGIEDYPLSYNMIKWSPEKNKWSTSFYSDPGNGSGFEQECIILNTIE